MDIFAFLGARSKDWALTRMVAAGGKQPVSFDLTCSSYIVQVPSDLAVLSRSTPRWTPTRFVVWLRCWQLEQGAGASSALSLATARRCRSEGGEEYTPTYVSEVFTFKGAKHADARGCTRLFCIH